MTSHHFLLPTVPDPTDVRIKLEIFVLVPITRQEIFKILEIFRTKMAWRKGKFVLWSLPNNDTGNSSKTTTKVINEASEYLILNSEMLIETTVRFLEAVKN